MNESTRQALLNLNRRFYDEGADRFSATRTHPWAGWKELLPALVDQKPWESCLDVGCGNGRFARFLEKAALLPQHYLGLDGSSALLDVARGALPTSTCTFLELGFDALPRELPHQPFDLIALFGVLHHLPGRGARQSWLEDLARRVAPGGLLAFSIWRLDLFPDRFEKLRLPVPPEFGLEDGDALLSFDGRQDLPRYCHFPTEGEIADFCRLPGFHELHRWRADGPSAADNLYVLMRKSAVLCSAAPQRST